MDDIDSNKQNTLAEALSKIETLTAENTKLSSDLANATSRILELEAELDAEKAAHNSAKESLAALEAKHRDIDKEVSARVAEVAAENGVAPVESVPNGGDDESLEDLAKRIDSANGIEKAKIIESNYDKIMSALKGVC